MLKMSEIDPTHYAELKPDVEIGDDDVEPVEEMEEAADGNAAKPKKAKKNKERAPPGASKRSQEQAKRILKHGDEEMIEQLDKGEISARKADQMIREREEEEKPPAEVPRGKFNIILEDPWAPGGSAYKVPDDAELADLPVKESAADDAILFMIAPLERIITGVNMPAGSVMAAQGFVPVELVTIVYEGSSKWSGGDADYLLIGTRGNVKPFGLDTGVVLDAGGARSTKRPDAIFEFIEECASSQNWTISRLDMSGKRREGWSKP